MAEYFRLSYSRTITLFLIGCLFTILLLYCLGLWIGGAAITYLPQPLEGELYILLAEIAPKLMEIFVDKGIDFLINILGAFLGFFFAYLIYKQESADN